MSITFEIINKRTKTENPTISVRLNSKDDSISVIPIVCIMKGL